MVFKRVSKTYSITKVFALFTRTTVRGNPNI